MREEERILYEWNVGEGEEQDHKLNFRHILSSDRSTSNGSSLQHHMYIKLCSICVAKHIHTLKAGGRGFKSHLSGLFLYENRKEGSQVRCLVCL